MSMCMSKFFLIIEADQGRGAWTAEYKANYSY